MQRTLRWLFVATLVGGVLASTLGALPRAWAAGSVAEPAIQTPGPVGDYLRRAHDRIHARWAEGFLKTAPAPGPAAPASAAPKPGATVMPGALTSDPHPVVLALMIRWDGTVADAILRASSGSPEIDRAAGVAARKSAPFPLPTSDVLSDDGYAHFEWTFARDQRGCSGAKLTRVEDPLDVALPRLVRGNRMSEALRRVGEAGAGARKDAGADALDRFARLYLSRSLPDPLLDTAASVALAGAGDKVQADRLRAALGSRATVKLAAKGLQKLGIDVCDVVRAPLEGGAAFEREMAFEAVRSLADDGISIAACRAPLETVAKDAKQPSATRLAAFDLLLAHLATEARPLVLALMTDKDPAVRGVATLASVKRGGGRPEMYRLTPLLRDKAVEVRGAASAGMVRAAGDLALDQLYLLAREPDPRPSQLVAAELGRYATPATAEFLGRLLKRENRDIQVAAAQALMARTDSDARALVESIRANPQASFELRQIAAGAPAHAPVALVMIEGESAPAAAVAAPTTTVTGAPVAPVTQFQDLLKAGKAHDAVGWVVGHLVSLAPADAVDVLGAWLVRDAVAAAGAAPAVEAAGAPPSAPRGATEASRSASTNALAF
jgi:hypothetical protein